MEYKMEKNNLSAEEMNAISGGHGCPNASHHFLIEARQREIFEMMKQAGEMIADVRMRMGEEALKAAMRLEHQEREMKEAVRAHREELGLN